MGKLIYNFNFVFFNWEDDVAELKKNLKAGRGSFGY